MTQIIPHIGFDGNAEEAFNFYKSVFGGELSLMRWKDNANCQDWSEEEKNQIMHASLNIGDGILMGNDVPKAMGQTIQPGNNFTVTLAPENEAARD
jgi:PhnB protein